MKTPQILLLISISFVFSFCNNSDPTSASVSKNIADSIKKKTETVQTEKGKKWDDYWQEDSIRLNEVLRGAMDSIAVKGMGERDSARYDVELDSVLVGVEIGSGNYFKGPFPYRLIRLSSPGSVRIHIYAKSSDTWDQILSHNQWGLEYVNDTIMDVNGDGRKDFVVEWYGTSGCCLKGFSKVYLLRDDMKSFSDQFEFINPTFSPKEHIVRGVNYGHAGYTDMYKYKWTGERVDTIEYVSYQLDNNLNKTGKVELRDADFRVIRVLPSVPKEYRKIDGYDWFTGHFY
jgi:hypothetical protein